MSQSTHVVCPSCQAVNRIPTARLGSHPKCGKCKSALFTGQPVELSDSTFAKHINRSDLPLVVDFWAAWCGPCKVLGPVLEKLADESAGAFELAKVDVDANQALAGQFGVQGIPTVVGFKDGQPVSQFTGALPETQVREWIRELVPSEDDLLANAAADLLAEGNVAAAEEGFRRVLASSPAHGDAATALRDLGGVLERTFGPG